MEAAPDLDAVEAAADHFAESVRADVSDEAEPPTTTPRPTEEIQIAALLGDDEDEAGTDVGQPEGRARCGSGPRASVGRAGRSPRRWRSARSPSVAPGATCRWRS